MINPNLNYSSPAEVKIYIGSSWVDDAYRIDYNLTKPSTPLYEYTSSYYKSVAEGNIIVQGQLIINFRFNGYLMSALNKTLSRDPNVIKDLSTSAAVFRDLSAGTAQEKINKLLAYKAAGTMSYAKQATNLMFGVGNAPSGVQTSKPMTEQISRGFDIEIRYGGEESLYKKTIVDCHIIGETQVISAAAMNGGDLSSSGMPIFEIYSFFGKSVAETIQQKAYLLNQKR